MYKIVIFNSNLDLIKKICNNVLNDFANIKLAGIANNKGELSLICNNLNSNIIIITYDDYQNKEILNLIEKIQYKIILYKGSNKFKNSSHILYLNIDNSEELYLQSLKNFLLNLNKKTVRQQVSKLLQDLNFDFKLLGTKYLLESIVYSYSHKDTYVCENLEKQVFPYVSKKYKVSTNNIKFSIIRSVNNMNANLKNEDLKRIYSNFQNKITSKSLITYIVHCL